MEGIVLASKLLENDGKWMEDFFGCEVVFVEENILSPFLATYGKKVLLSEHLGKDVENILYEKGFEVLRKDVNYAVGNLLAPISGKLLVSKFLDGDFAKEVESFFGLESMHLKCGPSDIVGPCFVETPKCVFGSLLLSDPQKESLEDFLGKKIAKITVNGGDPIIGNGFVYANGAAVVGELTTNIELYEINDHI
jgi:translation initiation factor 6 (eIF-6)